MRSRERRSNHAASMTPLAKPRLDRTPTSPQPAGLLRSRKSPSRPAHGSRRTAIAIAKSALMPIDSCFSPLRAAILAVSAKCGAGASSTGGMHIKPEIVEPVVVAAGCDKVVGVRRRDAGLLRLLAGIDLHEQMRRRLLLAISLANASQMLGRSTEWMASNSATASFALLDCSGPIRCSARPG